MHTYIYMYAYTHIHTCTHTYTYIHTYINIYMHTYTCIHKRTYIYKLYVVSKWLDSTVEIADLDCFLNGLILIKVAKKVRLGNIRHLCANERLCLKSLLRKPRTTYKRSLQGLFERHNDDGHMSFITKSKVTSIKKLYQRNMDVFKYYGIKGGSPPEVYGLLTRTQNSIPIMMSYLKTKRSVAHGISHAV